MKVTPWILLGLLMLTGCRYPYVTTDAEKDAHIGQRVEMYGTAVQALEGAKLDMYEGDVWIDGLGAWPPQLANRRVRAVGILARREFADPNAEPKWIYLLRDATWELVPITSGSRVQPAL